MLLCVLCSVLFCWIGICEEDASFSKSELPEEISMFSKDLGCCSCKCSCGYGWDLLSLNDFGLCSCFAESDLIDEEGFSWCWLRTVKFDLKFEVAVWFLFGWSWKEVSLIFCSISEKSSSLSDVCSGTSCKWSLTSLLFNN